MVALAPVAMFAFAWRESGAAVGFAGRLVRRSRRGAIGGQSRANPFGKEAKRWSKSHTTPGIWEISAKEGNMFAVVRHYHYEPRDGPKIDKMVREEFVPIIKQAKGFVRYYWLDTGKGEAASVSVFKDKAGADESVHLAADFVKNHMSKLVTQKPEIIEGPVKAHD